LKSKILNLFLFTELQMAFDAFDHQKKGIVSTDMIGTMLGMLGHEIRSSILSEVVAEFDPHGLYSNLKTYNYNSRKCSNFLLILKIFYDSSNIKNF
jgi:hypothetical protein